MSNAATIAQQVAEEAGWCYSPRGRGKNPRYGMADYDGLGVIRETIARAAGVDADTLPDLINAPLPGAPLASLTQLFEAMGLQPVKRWGVGDIVIYATHDGRHEPAVVLPPVPTHRNKAGRWINEYQCVRQAWGRPIARAWLGRMEVVAAYRIKAPAVRAAAAAADLKVAA